MEALPYRSRTRQGSTPGIACPGTSRHSTTSLLGYEELIENLTVQIDGPHMGVAIAEVDGQVVIQGVNLDLLGWGLAFASRYILKTRTAASRDKHREAVVVVPFIIVDVTGEEGVEAFCES